jgi:hypothetical protein
MNRQQANYIVVTEDWIEDTLTQSLRILHRREERPASSRLWSNLQAWLPVKAHYIGRRPVGLSIYSFLAYACTFYTIGVSVIMFTHGIPLVFGVFLAFINVSSVLFLFLKNPHSSQSQPHWAGA